MSSVLFLSGSYVELWGDGYCSVSGDADQDEQDDDADKRGEQRREDPARRPAQRAADIGPAQGKAERHRQQAGQDAGARSGRQYGERKKRYQRQRDWRAPSSALCPGKGTDGGDQAAQAQEQREMNAVRSEEHTSEHQSRMRHSYAVCCVKKKKRRQRTKKNK